MNLEPGRPLSLDPVPVHYSKRGWGVKVFLEGFCWSWNPWNAMSHMRSHWNVPRPKLLWTMKSSIPKCKFIRISRVSLGIFGLMDVFRVPPLSGKWMKTVPLMSDDSFSSWVSIELKRGDCRSKYFTQVWKLLIYIQILSSRSWFQHTFGTHP